MLAGIIPTVSSAQDDFYSSDSVREIRIYFSESNWDHILDSLYVRGDEQRLLGKISLDGTVYDSVGIRYKGFSSVSIDRKKNPFNIDLDYAIDGQNHQGYDKVKLSNVIQDPSFVREVLSYEIARKYMPASQANFANVYVNDTLFGLYTNVEAVNRDFLSKHYASRSNAFFKCNPDHLDLNGENSNLGDSPGTDSTDYIKYYDMKSDYGWSELYDLIDTINNQPADIESLLNIDQTLWMHAFNYALVNFDSYIGYAQNYYLYRDDNGRFNPIIWDLNMSFGSFRFTDASEFYQGFTVKEAPFMDPLTHVNSVSVYARPLIRNIMGNETHKRMFMAHLRTIMEENVASGEYYSSAQNHQDLIKRHVAADTNKFYTYADFEKNIDTTTSDLIEYPGLKDLMENRLAYLQDYPGYKGAPEISDVQHSQDVVPGDGIWISAEVADANDVVLAYRFSANDPFIKITMEDDGLGDDEYANDGIFGAAIPEIGTLLQYYVYAENDSAGQFAPERAAYEFYQLQFKLNPNDLVINELMASNTNGERDKNGEFSDWIELYNNSTNVISTNGLYLSDDPANLQKWLMPDFSIEPDGYLIVWANSSQRDGTNANFRLSANGEQLYMSYGDGTVLDSVIFGELPDNASYARSPNATGDFIQKFPSFGYNNDSTDIFKEFDVNDFVCYPNPTDDVFHIKLKSDSISRVQLMDINGHLLLEETIEPGIEISTFNTDNMANGLYIIRVINGGLAATKKLIKI